MANRKYQWVYSPAKEPKPKVPEVLKKLVQQRFDEIIATDLKLNCIRPPSPDNDFNYLADIFGKWYRNYFYICGIYNCPGPHAIAPTFEAKFSRFEYVGGDRFNVAYMRHTGQFCEFMQGLTLDECLEALKTTPHLRPM